MELAGEKHSCNRLKRLMLKRNDAVGLDYFISFKDSGNAKLRKFKRQWTLNLSKISAFCMSRALFIFFAQFKLFG
jgi:hypothetical protein